VKKLVFIVALILALALPASAENPVKVFVNGVQLPTEAVIINDRVYVPLRAVSESMGATVEWGEENRVVLVQENPSPKLKRPPIENGDEKFERIVTEALDLLEENDFPHYMLVCGSVSGIRRHGTVQGIPPESIACESKGKILILDAFTKNDQFYNPQCMAGTLVHEASHAAERMYDKNYNLRSWKQKEKTAFENQLAAFRLIDAPQWMQDGCIGWESRYGLN
jgi:hypothetical protein